MTEHDPHIDQMRGFIFLAESLLPQAPEDDEVVAVEEIAETFANPLIADLEGLVAKMRSLMESSGDAAVDEGADMASARWADAIENLIRRHVDGPRHLNEIR